MSAFSQFPNLPELLRQAQILKALQGTPQLPSGQQMDKSPVPIEKQVNSPNLGNVQPLGMGQGTPPQAPQQQLPNEQALSVPQQQSATSAYEQALQQKGPQISDYHPSLGRRIAGVALGAIAGMHDPRSGTAVGRGITYAPFEKQQSDYQANLGRLKEAANLEQGTQLKSAQEEELKARRGAQEATAKKEEAHRRQIEFQIEHPNQFKQGKTNLYVGKTIDGDFITIDVKPDGYYDASTNEKIDHTTLDPTKPLTRIGVEPKPMAPPKPPTPGSVGDYVKRYADEKYGGDTSKVTSDDLNKIYSQIAQAKETPALKASRQATTAHTASSAGQTSYNRLSGMLDKDFNQADTTLQRLSNLEETLNQNNAQADAVVFPELLSGIVGGFGSGFRMTQAEINNAVGGRTVWESLQATANKLRLDPQHTIIPDNQRIAIRNLERAIRAKATGRLNIIRKADRMLSETNDPMKHRKIMSDFRDELANYDSGTEKSQGGEDHSIQDILDAISRKEKQK